MCSRRITSLQASGARYNLDTIPNFCVTAHSRKARKPVLDWFYSFRTLRHYTTFNVEIGNMTRIKIFAALLVCGTAIVLSVLPSSLASASGKPSRAPRLHGSGDFPAGLACSFEVASQTLTNKEFTTTFPAEANGDVVQLVTGYLVQRFTNVGTGKSISANVSGPGTIVFHPDGSVTLSAEGPSILILFPGDIPSGPSFVINYGKFVVNITPSEQFIVQKQTGTQFDVCAALS
jgi:hypothetical protein